MWLSGAEDDRVRSIARTVTYEEERNAELCSSLCLPCIVCTTAAQVLTRNAAKTTVSAHRPLPAHSMAHARCANEFLPSRF
jgi:hypothetical protein